MGRRLLFLSLVVLQAATLTWPGAARGALIDYEDGRLSADAQGVQAESLFAALEKQAGVRVEASKQIREKSVTVSFRALPVEDGMRQIVRSLGIPGYAVLYDPKAARQTYVLMESTAAAPSLAKPSVAPPAPVAAADPNSSPTPRQLDKEELLELAKQRREARLRSDPERQQKLEAKRLEKEDRKRANEERKQERAEQKRERDGQKGIEREARRAAREAVGANPVDGAGKETVERARQ